MRRVASSLKPKPTPRYVIRVPLNKPLGKRIYTVESNLDPISFGTRKDAKALKDLLKRSLSSVDSDIVRREIMDDGYIPTYGEDK